MTLKLGFTPRKHAKNPCFSVLFRFLITHTPVQVRPKSPSSSRARRPTKSSRQLAASRRISPAPHAVLSGGILGGAPPSLLRTARAALMRARTSLKTSRAGSEMSRARASWVGLGLELRLGIRLRQ